ncbi:MAG: AMP-binding protein [Syntrophobacteraceae bacterium]|nr:AMP-binding protein [Syntrophobacteraceae bacterium]
MGMLDFTLYDLIVRNALCFGNRPAWFEVDDKTALTFAQYKENVDRLAFGLQKSGIEKGDRIGVLGKNSLPYFLLYGAAAAVGAIMLPLNWRLSADEIYFNLNDCTPKIVFADLEFQDLIDKIRPELSSVKDFCNLKGDEGRFTSFDSLMESSAHPPVLDFSDEEGFVIIHTAAVAGRPRGALLSHRNICCSSLHFHTALNITPEDVHLNLLPMFHIAGLSMLFQSFHAGALTVNMSKFDAAKAVDLIVEKKCSVMFDFAPILSLILEQQEKSGKSIESLRAVVGIESPETIEKYQKVSKGAFYVMYGQTETSCLATLGPYDARPGSAGSTILLGRIALFDDYDRAVAPGQTGEIGLKGPMVFKGYWNLPEDNAYTFRDGWHHTGDLGRFDEDGYLWYAGRKAEKELIKPGGENVYPAEVEKVILQHPAVEATVVLGVPDPKWKEGIKAVCTLKKGASLVPGDLIKFVGERIAGFKKPQYVEFVEELPLLADGSPDRAEIKKRYGAA